MAVGPLSTAATVFTWDRIIAWTSAVVATVVTVSLKIISGKVKSVDDNIAETEKNIKDLGSRLEQYNSRIVTIESSYVKREDLEEVVYSLQEDLKKSFDRAHSRIDELYKRPGGRDV